MNKKLIQRYVKKQVKLVLDNNYVLYGQITEAFDDCFVFSTITTDSVIRNDSVKQITPKE